MHAILVSRTHAQHSTHVQILCTARAFVARGKLTRNNVSLSCLSFCSIGASRSTDFDVHRNWLAITHSLPMKQWYLEVRTEAAREHLAASSSCAAPLSMAALAAAVLSFLSRRVSGRWTILRSSRFSSGCCRFPQSQLRPHSLAHHIDSHSDLVAHTRCFLLPNCCRYFDPQMLVITAEPYQSPRTVLYQRLTVIVSDIVLFYAIIQ